MIKRYLSDYLAKELQKPEITIITGPRRIGKTTLLRAILQQAKSSRATLYVDFTDTASLALWQDLSKEKISSIVEEMGGAAGKKVIFFDEIQYLSNSGRLLKLFYDHFPEIKVFATGSSSFLLLQSIGESLAGRKKLITLFPLSLGEISGLEIKDFWSFKKRMLLADKFTSQLENCLIYGAYPEITRIPGKDDKIEKLKDISDSFLFKDLLVFEHIKKPRVLVELAKLLAYQIGSLVNPNELSSSLGISRKTVLDYIDLLERFFIIQRVYPYEKNMRDVIRKQFKAYFFDTGIRNAIIGDFRGINQRNDAGFLLENAVAMGLIRRISYERLRTEVFFWRDYDGKEMDLLLKDQDIFTAFEVKWKRAKNKIPKGFIKYFLKADTYITDSSDAYRFCL